MALGPAFCVSQPSYVSMRYIPPYSDAMDPIEGLLAQHSVTSYHIRAFRDLYAMAFSAEECTEENESPASSFDPFP